MTAWERAELKALTLRIRANVGPFHGLTQDEYEKHIAGIVAVVWTARRRGRLP